MQVFSLEFRTNKYNKENCVFFIKDEDYFIHVFINQNKKVALVNTENFIYCRNGNQPIELFELAFNEKFLNYIKNANENLFFNGSKNKKIFQKFKNTLLNIKVN